MRCTVTMRQLRPDFAPAVLDLVEQADGNTLMARAVLIGDANGQAYVDDEYHPAACHVVHQTGMSFLFGVPQDGEFTADLRDHLVGNRTGRNRDQWLQAFSPSWHDELGPWLSKGKASAHRRINYRLDPQQFSAAPDVAGFDVVITPAEMLPTLGDRVAPRDYWSHPERLTKMSAAWTALINGTPAATAFASAVAGDQWEIGIETVPRFRGRGLARLACSRLIERCLADGLEVLWSCREGNTGSQELAARLGFDAIAITPYYHFPAF